ncbi:hypothetical protein PAXRUDRAFT_150538, partial [Paxillus rubicundulus Ve08.2h10]
HKLTYFKAAWWEDKWINTMETLVCREFEHSLCMSSLIMNISLALTHFQSINIFDNLPAPTPLKTATLGSELDHDLKVEVEHVTDALAWWHESHAIYPQLSCMAL